MTDKQRAAIERMIAARDIDPEDLDYILGRDWPDYSIPNRDVTAIFNALRTYPFKARVEESTGKTLDDVPTGSYTLANGTHVRIQKSRTSKKHYLLRGVNVGDDAHTNLHWSYDQGQKDRALVAAVIAELQGEDVLRSAALKYGRLTGNCFRCDAPLSDTVSSMALVGPHCVKHLYPEGSGGPKTLQARVAREELGYSEKQIEAAKRGENPGPAGTEFATMTEYLDHQEVAA
jgi:hypothetical protein